MHPRGWDLFGRTDMLRIRRTPDINNKTQQKQDGWLAFLKFTTKKSSIKTRRAQFFCFSGGGGGGGQQMRLCPNAGAAEDTLKKRGAGFCHDADRPRIGP